MTRAKKGGAAAANIQVGRSFGLTLFEKLQVSKLRLLLEQLLPNHKVEQRGASALLMKCSSPAHADHRPSFYVYANINQAICKSCGYRTRSLLDFLHTALGFSYAESLTRIHEITGQKLANDRVSKQLDELDLHQQATRFFGEVCNQHLSLLNSYTLQGNNVDKGDEPYYNNALFHTVKPVQDWLYKQRQLDPAKVQYLPYGLMPTDALFERLAQRVLEQLWSEKLRAGVLPSAYSEDRRKALLAKLVAMHKETPVEYLHSVTFHTGFSTTVAGRIRCRKVSRDTGTDNNFWMLPGFNESDPVGYLGLYLPNNNGLRRVEVESYRVKLVESEISMLTAQEKLIEHSTPDVMFMASAGSNNETDMLYQAGFTDVDLLMDHPDPRYGRGEAQVMIRLNTAMMINARVFTGWEPFRNDVLTLKDPDDVLQYHGYDHFRKYVLTEEDKWFVPADAWASERAIEEGLQIPANKILERQKKATDFGQCIRHPALLAAFVSRVSSALDIAQGPLRAAIVQIKDDEAGFIARIVETFKSEFVVLYKDDVIRAGTLVLFHKAERRYMTVNVNDGPGIMAALSNIYGEMYSYFVDHIGLQDKQDGEEHIPSRVTIRDGQKYIADYLKIAFQAIYQGVLTQDECIPVGTGVHPYPHPDDPDLTIIRIHNGDRWFRVIVDRRTDQAAATELEGPIDGPYLFLPNQERWSESLISAEAINEANKMPRDRLQEIYVNCCKMLESWKFKSQKADVAFLAALIFAIAAGDAFLIKLIFRIIGESNSGKSTLLSMYCKGQDPSLQLVEQAKYNTGYTAPSLYLQFNHSTLAMILEEASQDDGVMTHKTKQLEDIQEMLRQIGYERGAQIIRFGQNGKVTRYEVRTNAALTAVHEPRDIQDANRSYTVETTRDDNHRDPAVQIAALFTLEERVKMRHDIQLGIIRFLPKLRQAQNEIYTTLNEKQLASFQAPTRFLRNFAPIGAVLQVLGFDWEPLVAMMIESRKERLLSQASASSSSIVYDKLLRASVVPIPGARNSFLSVMQCATMPNGYELLNSSGIGITLNPNNWTLIVDFVAATSPGGAVYRMNDLNKKTPHQLKALLDHHPDIVRPHRYRELGVMEALAANNITALDFEISVLTIGRLRNQVVTRAAAYNGLPMTSTKPEGEGDPGDSGSSSNNM
jgi:hypothetical protein